MSIRATLKENPGVAIGTAACAILLASGMLIWREFRPTRTSVGIPKAFYSDDDGATWFLDDAMKPVPFDHDGKQAYLAMVFRCGDGNPFVAYLAGYSDADNARLAKEGPPPPGMARPPLPWQVKVPGKTRWIGLTSGARAVAEFDRIIAPVCPEGGSERPTLVSPGDQNNGATNR